MKGKLIALRKTKFYFLILFEHFEVRQTLAEPDVM